MIDGLVPLKQCCVCSSVCSKQELAQLELEKAEDLIASKTTQRDQLVSSEISVLILPHL